MNRGDKARRERLGAVIDAELGRAEGGEDGELGAARAEALKYYYARPRGDEIKGRSQVISTDVADMVNATLAMIVPMISTDCVVEFEPNGLEDEPAARMESDAVNKVMLEDNRGFIEIQEAVKDALLQRNGCLKVFTEDSENVRRLEVPDGLAREQLAMLLQPQIDGEARELEDGLLTITTPARRFRVEAVPIENISYQAGYSGELQGIRFFAERMDYTRSDLVELGFDRKIVDGLAATGVRDATGARSQRDGTATAADARDAETRDQDVIDCHEVYQLIDLDGDGISERYRALVADRSTVLEYEPADVLPYALGSPFLNPHRITGESLFDHIKSSQDVKTALGRQLIDNVTVINNGRYAYDPDQVNEQDVLRPRAGGGIRARNPSMALVPIVIPDVTSGILAALQYEDKRRTERGGASLEMLSSDMQLAGETAHGVERQYASREALASMMATNLGETLIRGAYALMHQAMRLYSIGPLMVRRSGEYVEVDPRRWPERTRLNVTTGMTPGARGHMEQALGLHQQMQNLAVQAGGLGVLVDPGSIFRTAVERLRMAGVPNPERHAVDPDSPQARAAAQAKQQEGAQAAAQAQQLQQAMLQIEGGKVEVSRQGHQLDRQTDIEELRFKYDQLRAELAQKKRELEAREAAEATRAVVDLDKARRSESAQTMRRAGDGQAGQGSAEGGASGNAGAGQ